MAHQIDFQKGSAAFVSLRQKAWHGLGTIIETEMTVAEAIKFANLDFIVEKLPNRHFMPNPDGSFKEVVSGTSFFTFRTDTNHVLGDRLGRTYTVVQNEDALGVVDSLVSEGGLIIESAGSLYDGCTVFMCLRMPEPMKVAGVDEVQQYVVIAAGHDGGTPLLAFFTNTRVVCNNTLQVALGGAVQKHSIRHTANAMNRLDEALKIMKLGVKNTAAMQKTYDRMTARQINKQAFFDYVGNLFCTPAEIDALQSGKQPDEVLSTRKGNIIGDVLAFADNGIGQKEANPGSLWWAYNAVTGYFSNKDYNDPDARMDNLLWGSQAATMEKALVLADDPAKIQTLRSNVLANANTFLN